MGLRLRLWACARVRRARKRMVETKRRIVVCIGVWFCFIRERERERETGPPAFDERSRDVTSRFESSVSERK
jgi:hypothetical protein